MTQLEQKSPELKKIADELGYKIHYRGKAYWAGADIQLTYEVINEKRTKTLEERIPTAIKILQKIKDARDLKRTPQERLHELIEILNKTDYIPSRMFTHFYTPEHDEMVISRFGGEFDGSLYLIGEPKLYYPNHKSREGLLKSLMATEESYLCPA